MAFDTHSVREAWDLAADGYAQGQASGRDYYRYEFFGPAHADLCGDVRGRRLLDVGCGSGYFTREMAARGEQATGIDISPRMIALANEQPRWLRQGHGQSASIIASSAGRASSGV